MEAIGKIIGSHGVKGHIVLEHTLKQNVDHAQWDALMVELLPNSKIPFFIEKLQIQTNNTLLIKLEEINSPEDAKEVLQKNVFLSPNAKVDIQSVKVEVDNYIGYTLYDKDKEVGIIDNILNPKTNPLFIIHENTDNELLVPANEELIMEVKRKDKKVIANIPLGLL